MGAHPKCAPIILDTLEKHDVTSLQEGKIGVKMSVIWRTVMSFSSAMTTLHQHFGHWEALVVCIVVLVALCKMPKSECNLDFKSELQSNLKNSLHPLLENSFFLIPSREFAMFWHNFVDLNESRRMICVTHVPGIEIFHYSIFWFKLLELVLKLSESIINFWKCNETLLSSAFHILLFFR